MFFLFLFSPSLGVYLDPAGTIQIIAYIVIWICEKILNEMFVFFMKGIFQQRQLGNALNMTWKNVT